MMPSHEKDTPILHTDEILSYAAAEDVREGIDQLCNGSPEELQAAVQAVSAIRTRQVWSALQQAAAMKLGETLEAVSTAEQAKQEADSLAVHIGIKEEAPVRLAPEYPMSLVLRFGNKTSGPTSARQYANFSSIDSPIDRLIENTPELDSGKSRHALSNPDFYMISDVAEDELVAIRKNGITFKHGGDISRSKAYFNVNRLGQGSLSRIGEIAYYASQKPLVQPKD